MAYALDIYIARIEAGSLNVKGGAQANAGGITKTAEGLQAS